MSALKKLALWVAALSIGVAYGASDAKLMKVDRQLTKEAKGCIDCHGEKSPGIVHDWKDSRHGHVGVSCIDCHQVKADSPMAAQNCPGVKGTKIFITCLVTPKVCARCHPQEEKEFAQSGHARAALQIIPKEGLQKLMNVHEGRSHPQLKGGPNETGCMQCHGETIKLQADKSPTPETWPNSGIGTIWPDGSVGNCTTCHTRHKFSIAEARKPEACASCHLGPDHPNIEIYRNSKHGHIYATEGKDWKFDSAPDAWEPGDYRAPTCATCHLSGIGELSTSHNVSARLRWNLWAPLSKERNSKDPLSPLTGNAKEGRKAMTSVCKNCHGTMFATNYFKQADKHIMLYNEAYYKKATAWLDDLKTKKLLKKNPWKDKFQIAYYFLWHHEGRRMRQGAAMGAPDYAHWHGSFECMQRIYELEEIYEKRIKTKKIEE